MNEALPQAAAAAVVSDAKTNSQLFNTALSELLRGDFQSISAAEWRLLATHGAMSVCLVLILLFLALTAAGWAAAAVRTSLTRAKFDPTLAKFLAKMTRWGILLIAGIVCLGTFGVETTGLAAVLGAAGFAIGMAFQGTLSSFAAGAMLLIFRPFKVGDTVNIAGQSGTVDEIELFTTTLDTADNRRIILPNNAVFGTTIENITYHRVRRADVSVGVAYDADIDQTRRVLESAIASTEGALVEPAPEVVLVALGASSVDWSVRAWAPTAQVGVVKQELIRSVKLRLDAAGIGIPFPQMDVHVRDAAAQHVATRRAA
ncbi:MAG: mechanosensitive ion channel family protein [Lacipirellulaceae bacterium]